MWVIDEFPRSFWHRRPAAPREVEAVVVGGGIVGLSTAWWLARSAPPGWRVVVLEAEGLAGHASGRNAGFLLTGTPEPYTELVRTMGRDAALSLWLRSRENRELVRTELLDSGLVDAEFLPEGSWHAALAHDIAPPPDPLPASPPPTPTSPEEGAAGLPSRRAGAGHEPPTPHDPAAQEAALRESCQLLRDEGLDCEWRDAAAVREASGSRHLGGAIFQARDGGLDPVRLCRGLAATGGFEVRTGVRVTALEPADDPRVRVVTEEGDWLAERVVVALNAYAPVLLPHLAREIQPVRGQMFATAPGQRPLTGVWYVNDGHEYLRQTSDGAVVLGGRRQVGQGAEVGFQETPTGRIQGALEDFLAHAFPHLAGRPVRHRWAGIMAFTPDGLPRFGAVPDVPGALYAAGFNGHGMSLGFLSGRHLAQRTLAEHRGAEPPEELLAPARPGSGG